MILCKPICVFLFLSAPFGSLVAQTNVAESDRQQGLAAPKAIAHLVPANTFALIVGVLSWEQDSLTEYSPELRQDVVLHRQLLRIGVPKENTTVLLDRSATRAAINQAVDDICKRANKGSTLLIYYAGHGMTNGDEGIFACYDLNTRKLQETGWRHQKLADSIEKNFPGDNVLLFADCCFSGALEIVAKRLSEKGFRAASLTSANAVNTSTNQWTYTQSLIEAITGKPFVDKNADGVIMLSEAAENVQQTMLHFESQQSGFTAHNLTDFRLAATKFENTDRPTSLFNFTLGQYVSAKRGKKWTTGRVLDARTKAGHPGELLIQFQTYNERPTSWLPATEIRPTAPPDLKQGPPEPLADDEAIHKASINGKLTKLLKKFEVESDFPTYGAFYNFGKWTGTSHAGHRNLPTGHWVYVYPHWYIWELAGDAPIPNAQLVAQPDPVQAVQAAEQAIPHWDAKQIIGKPNSPAAGDQATAWAPATMNDEKVWAQVEFAQAVQVSEIHIYENCAPGTVYQVSAFIDGTETRLWKGVDPTPKNAGRGTSIIPIDHKAVFKVIRIYMDCRRAPGWNEIDAVALVETRDNKIHWAVDAQANSTYNQGVRIPFADPFLTDKERRTEKIRSIDAEIQSLKEQVRQYDQAIQQRSAKIKLLYKQLDQVK